MAETKVNPNQINSTGVLKSISYSNGTFIKEYTNNYVEIFGFVERSGSTTTVTLPVTMADTNYYVGGNYGGNNIDSGDTDSNFHIAIADNGTSKTQIKIYAPRSTSSPNKLYWEVQGFKE